MSRSKNRTSRNAEVADFRRKKLVFVWQQIREIAENLQRIEKNQKRPQYARHDRLFTQWVSRLSALTKELRQDLIETEAQWWQERYPNLSQDISALVNKVERNRGEAWCDLDELADEIKRAYDHRTTTLSWQRLVAQAQRLMPGGVLLRDPETKTVRLQCRLEHSWRSGRTTALPWGATKPLGALTQIAQVLRYWIPPVVVTPSSLLAVLVDPGTRHDVTGRWWDLPPLRLRFHDNGCLDVRCETPKLAQDLADALTEDLSVQLDDQNNLVVVHAETV